MASCDATCRSELYCEMVTTDYFQNAFCRGVQEVDFIHDPYSALMNHLTNTWI